MIELVWKRVCYMQVSRMRSSLMLHTITAQSVNSVNIKISDKD